LGLRDVSEWLKSKSSCAGDTDVYLAPVLRLAVRMNLMPFVYATGHHHADQSSPDQ